MVSTQIPHSASMARASNDDGAQGLLSFRRDHVRQRLAARQNDPTYKKGLKENRGRAAVASYWTLRVLSSSQTNRQSGSDSLSALRSVSRWQRYNAPSASRASGHARPCRSASATLFITWCMRTVGGTRQRSNGSAAVFADSVRSVGPRRSCSMTTSLRRA